MTTQATTPYRISSPVDGSDAESPAILTLRATIIHLREMDLPESEADCKELLRRLWCETMDVAAQITVLGVLSGEPRALGEHMEKGAAVVKAIEAMVADVTDDGYGE